MTGRLTAHGVIGHWFVGTPGVCVFCGVGYDIEAYFASDPDRWVWGWIAWHHRSTGKNT